MESKPTRPEQSAAESSVAEESAVERSDAGISDAVAPPSRAKNTAFWQRIATHNPFYAISAALVFYGLRTSFNATTETHSMVLMASLAAYVVLLTTTALVLRRLGTLWEDVRMLVLLVLLLLLGISVTFDAVLLAHPRLGTGYFLGGWLFAAVTCEALLFGLRVRLPLSYRGPFHALLALFFLYPLGAARLAATSDEATLSWFLFGFAPTAAILLLTLLPAVLRGPAFVADNGTPWRWPLFPLTLFAVLTLGVVGRAYYLCYSFDSAPDGESIFGVYFLMPLAWSVSLLVLAALQRHGSPRAATLSLLLPVTWTLLAGQLTKTVAADATYGRFLERYLDAFGGSPAAVVVGAAAIFYAVAWALQVRRSFSCLICALLAASCVHGRAVSVLDIQPLIAEPLLLAGALKLVWGLYRSDVVGCSTASALLTLAVGVWSRRSGVSFPLLLTYHTAVASLLIVGTWFYDRRGRWVRAAVAVLLFYAATTALFRPDGWLFTAAPQIVPYYPWMMLAVTLPPAVWLRDPMLFFAAVGVAVEWAGLRCSTDYLRLRRLAPGLDAIALGLLAFATAVGLSIAKLRRLTPSAADDDTIAAAPPG